MNLKQYILIGALGLIIGKSYAQELYADNIGFDKSVQLVDSTFLLAQSDEDEFLFPELDLEENWSTDKINPYNVDVSQLPDSVRINCSEFAMPTSHFTRITDIFGYRPRRRRYHYGIDLKVQKGDTIYAAFDGKVRIRKYNRGGYGYYLVLRHNNGLETLYGHLSRFNVNVGDEVKVGDPIGFGGSTGRSTGPHLHFETRFLGKALDPAEIFDFEREDVNKDTYTVYLKTNKFNQTKTLTTNSTLAQQEDVITYHRVKSGDTLSKIAKRNGTTIAQLCKLNGLRKNSVLRVGQVLRCF